VLISKTSTNSQYVAHQERAIDILKAHGIEPEVINGSDPKLNDLRNILFRMSGIYDVYPQFFLREQKKTEFLGDFDFIESKNDDDTLKHILNSSKLRGLANGETKDDSSDANDNPLRITSTRNGENRSNVTHESSNQVQKEMMLGQEGRRDISTLAPDTTDLSEQVVESTEGSKEGNHQSIFTPRNISSPPSEEKDGHNVLSLPDEKLSILPVGEPAIRSIVKSNVPVEVNEKVAYPIETHENVGESVSNANAANIHTEDTKEEVFSVENF